MSYIEQFIPNFNDENKLKNILLRSKVNLNEKSAALLAEDLMYELRTLLDTEIVIIDKQTFSELSEAYDDIQDLYSHLDALDSDYTYLEEKYKELQKEYKGLQKEYKGLQEKCKTNNIPL